MENILEKEINVEIKGINLVKSIRSFYIINKIFSFLELTKKLEIIKHNKILQNKLKLNIEYYKKISGKYKIDGKNGNGIEFSLRDNSILFEGEYVNGKRNGNGKEYNNEKLIFEGKYVNGKKYGIGKEFNNEKIIFEGEYKNGKKWNGTLYNRRTNIKFIIKDGKRDGQIKEYDNIKKIEKENENEKEDINGIGKE